MNVGMIPRSGDILIHTPSGNTVTVAWAEGDRVSLVESNGDCWPLSSFTVSHRASDAEHAAAVRAGRRRVVHG